MNAKLDNVTDENVLDRLRRLTRIARQFGFEIRGEPLGGGGSTWCEMRGKRVLFLDLSQPATEQAIAIREILDETASIRPHASAASGLAGHLMGIQSTGGEVATIARAA